MNRRQIREQAREWLDDFEAVPYLASDKKLNDYIDEAQREAVLRTRLLVDSHTRALTQIAVPANVAEFKIDPLVIFIKRAVFYNADNSMSWRLERVTYDTLDQHQNFERLFHRNSNWEQITGARPHSIVQDLQRRMFRITPIPTGGGTLKLTVVRYPIECEQLLSDDKEPVLDQHDHRALAHWACAQAYANRDAETLDPKAEEKHRAKFTEHFGPHPTLAQIRNAATDRAGEVESYFF